jgi:hypothetical protein
MGMNENPDRLSPYPLRLPIPALDLYLAKQIVGGARCTRRPG